MNSTNGSQVAVLIDFENVFRGFRKKIYPPEPLDWENVLDAARAYGGPLICKAYADWSGNWHIQDRFSKLGIQPVTVLSTRWGKNGVDVKIAVDALDMMIVKNNNIGTLVLVSGDGDFTPLVNYLKDYGKIVVGIGIEGQTAEYLVSACHEFKFLSKNSGLVDANRKEVAGQSDKPAAVEELRLADDPPQTAVAEPEASDASGRGDSDETQEAAPEAADAADKRERLVREYIEILHRNKIPIDPTENRHFIIKKSYYFLKKHSGKRLAEILEKITGYFGKRRPGIDKGHVSDSIQQILEASCLEFENRPDDAAPSSEPWEKKVKLKSSIDDPRSLLRSIDRFLSEIIQRESVPNEINCEALSKVLYGTAEKPELVKQVRRMVGRSDQAAPSI